MKKSYEKPKIEIYLLNDTDIIQTSGEKKDDGSNDGMWYFIK